MKKCTLIIGSVICFLTMLVSGCADFEYTGRSFDPIPEGTAIAWHSKANPVPSGKYRIIGRGVLRYKIGEYDSYDVEEIMLDEARRHGADAVMLQATFNDIEGDYETDISNDAARVPAPKPGLAKMADGTKVPVNSFGKEVNLTGAANTTKKNVVYAVFYKNAAAVQKLIESQPVRMMQTKEKPSASAGKSDAAQKASSDKKTETAPAKDAEK